jgi:hypothetical protein
MTYLLNPYTRGTYHDNIPHTARIPLETNV